MSSLLLDEEPLLIMPQLAVKIGLNEAIVLQQIHYWLRHNKKEKKNFIDGRYWTYNTYDKWREQFPFWSVSTIKRAIYNLEEKGLVYSTSEFNKIPIDKTKWYTINYDILEKFEHEPTCQNDTTTYQNATSQNDTKDVSKRDVQRVKLKRPIPETKTETKKKTNIPKYGKDNFNNFDQREYDYDDLEKKLLGWK